MLTTSRLIKPLEQRLSRKWSHKTITWTEFTSPILGRIKFINMRYDCVDYFFSARRTILYFRDGPTTEYGKQMCLLFVLGTSWLYKTWEIQRKVEKTAWRSLYSTRTGFTFLAVTVESGGHFTKKEDHLLGKSKDDLFWPNLHLVFFNSPGAWRITKSLAGS